MPRKLPHCLFSNPPNRIAMRPSILTSLLLCALLWLGTILLTKAQQIAPIDSLTQQFNAGELTDAEYLRLVDRWMDQTFASGELFDKNTLINLLEPYRRLAWQEHILDAHRINYYIHLNNNASYAHREGESIYFLEKAEQQIIELYNEKPLMVAGRKCNSYANNHHYRNVINTYEAEKEYLQSFPGLLSEKNINLNIAGGFINVLHPTAHAYAMLGDTANLEETIQLAESIYEAFAQYVGPEIYTGFSVHFYMQSIHHYKQFVLLRNEAGSAAVLADMQQALHPDTVRFAALVETLRSTWIDRAVQHHLTFHNNDSAAHYLALLKETRSTVTQPASIYRYESQLMANEGQLEQAYLQASTALAKLDSTQAVLVNDIDELLYAHTEAEFAHSALLASE